MERCTFFFCIIAAETVGTCTSTLQHFRFLTADVELVQSDGWFLRSASLQIETQRHRFSRPCEWFAPCTRLVAIVQDDMHLRPTSHIPVLLWQSLRSLCYCCHDDETEHLLLAQGSVLSLVQPAEQLSKFA